MKAFSRRTVLEISSRLAMQWGRGYSGWGRRSRWFYTVSGKVDGGGVGAAYIDAVLLMRDSTFPAQARRSAHQPFIADGVVVRNLNGDALPQGVAALQVPRTVMGRSHIHRNAHVGPHLMSHNAAAPCTHLLLHCKGQVDVILGASSSISACICI